MKNYSDQHIEEDLKVLIEETFDTCSTNREELYWIIILLRAFMRIGNKRIENKADVMQLNMWQYQMVPIVEQFMKKWKL